MSLCPRLLLMIPYYAPTHTQKSQLIRSNSCGNASSISHCIPLQKMRSKLFSTHPVKQIADTIQYPVIAAALPRAHTNQSIVKSPLAFLNFKKQFLYLPMIVDKRQKKVSRSKETLSSLFSTSVGHSLQDIRKVFKKSQKKKKIEIPFEIRFTYLQWAAFLCVPFPSPTLTALDRFF